MMRDRDYYRGGRETSREQEGRNRERSRERWGRERERSSSQYRRRYSEHDRDLNRQSYPREWEQNGRSRSPSISRHPREAVEMQRGPFEPHSADFAPTRYDSYRPHYSQLPPPPPPPEVMPTYEIRPPPPLIPNTPPPPTSHPILPPQLSGPYTPRRDFIHPPESTPPPPKYALPHDLSPSRNSETQNFYRRDFTPTHTSPYTPRRLSKGYEPFSHEALVESLTKDFESEMAKFNLERKRMREDEARIGELARKAQFDVCISTLAVEKLELRLEYLDKQLEELGPVQSIPDMSF
ncbi:hypothetical protein K7432_003433 [Basidiobolus ranarum]|uniref:Uncharacterized protein n=1 Tax=Basidiobolus ranarum TaxID=34480 RepID=A0ABR2WZT0_9FUNG